MDIVTLLFSGLTAYLLGGGWDSIAWFREGRASSTTDCVDCWELPSKKKARICICLARKQCNFHFTTKDPRFRSYSGGPGAAEIFKGYPRNFSPLVTVIHAIAITVPTHLRLVELLCRAPAVLELTWSRMAMIPYEDVMGTLRFFKGFSREITWYIYILYIYICVYNHQQ